MAYVNIDIRGVDDDYASDEAWYDDEELAYEDDGEEGHYEDEPYDEAEEGYAR